MKRIRLKQVHGQPSYVISSNRVQVAVTRLGGHLGPVTFKLGRRTLRPFSLAPWWNERLAPGTPALLRALRGDFFCLPFGGNATAYHGEKHPPHGESANTRWSFADYCRTEDEVRLSLTLDTRIRPGHIEKRLTLVRGQTVIYQEHLISGMSGRTSLGHHAMLKFPDRPGSGRISTSSLIYGQVLGEPAERPEQRGYSCLKPGATFEDLDSVPTVTGEMADLSRYPARRGFEDIAILVADPKLPLAWSAVAFPEDGYVWFSLRDPRQLTSTLLWMSNGGRHYPPWNGRHVNVLGVEDITGYFHQGLSESASPNDLSSKGVKTHLALDPKQPLSIKYIMGLAAIPKAFDRVRNIDTNPDGVTLTSDSGLSVHSPLNVGFLKQP